MEMENMNGGNDSRQAPTPLVGNIHAAHCHDCWKYTDSVNRERELIHSATSLIINANAAAERTDAYDAAVKYLTRLYSDRSLPPALPGWGK
jgi:hypothetical protein